MFSAMTGTKNTELDMVSEGVQVGDEGAKLAQSNGDSLKVDRSAKDVEALERMREKVEVLDPASKDVDDATLLRFLRARSMDVNKSANLFVEHQKWRQTYLPLGTVQEEDIKDELADKKFFLQGKDRRGRPVAVVLAVNHICTKDVEQWKRCIAYCLDKLIACMPPGEETFVVIADLKDIKFKNLDPRAWLAALNFLQAYYPERMGRVYVVHTPYIFWSAWKLVAPFIHQVTRDKIVFVDEKIQEETLLKDISKEEIPTMYGGMKELVLLQDAQPPNWPPSKPA